MTLVQRTSTIVRSEASPFRNVIGVFCAISSIMALASANPILTAVGMLTPILLHHLLWRAGEPPAMLFATGFLWLQAFSPVLSANMEGKTLQEVFGGPELQLAAWLTLASIVVVAIGAAMVMRGTRMSRDATKQQASQLNLNRVFNMYLVCLILSTVVTFVASKAGGMRQPILAFSGIKWVPYFLLGWATMQHRRPPGLLIVATGIEVVLGFTGFFSAFKNVLFMLFVVVVGATSLHQRIRWSTLSVVVVFGAVLCMYWQAVKVDYRNFLNQGTGMQVILVPLKSRIQYLARAATRVTTEDMWEGAINGVTRLGYIDYFAHSIRSVPTHIEHQRGVLWLGAIQHTVMPRILFPNKAEINASERTMKFTHLRVAGKNQGTSISIGYPGESYIDFGIPGMFVPILLLGMVYGWIFRYFAYQQEYNLLGQAAVTTILLSYAIQIEASNISMVGGLTTSVIAFIVMMRFGAATTWIWLCDNQSSLRKIK